MLAVLVSKWVANAFGRNGMYASPLASYAWRSGGDHPPIFPVSDLVARRSYDEHVIMAGYPFLDIKTRVGDHSHVLAEIMHVRTPSQPQPQPQHSHIHLM